MYVLELSFTDDSRRLEARPAHRDRLQRMYSDGVLLSAGPWVDDSGALLVFATDRDQVEQLMADDPYYTTPGVTVVALREWQPVVGP
jgi:uncharacterized protein YciI